MRIGLVSTLSALVTPDSIGSVESLVAVLAREFVARGHEVCVFGSAGSGPAGKLVASLPGPYGAPGSLMDWYLCEWVNLCTAVAASARFDVLHSHAYLWGVPLQPLAAAPMVHTLHIVPNLDMARIWETAPSSCVTAITNYQWSGYPHLSPAAVIPHGVDARQFTLRERPDDYICYIGRFTSGKGPCQAVSVARELGLRLLMAGPRSDYFDQRVRPLVNGSSVEYVGVVKNAARDAFLGGARALVYPIQYAESFGLVLIEAMLSGTPVAALRVGAVRELVDEGVTGYTAENLAELPQAVSRCLSLDRRRVRERAEQRFSVSRMVEAYLRVYEQVIDRGRVAA